MSGVCSHTETPIFYYYLWTKVAYGNQWYTMGKRVQSLTAIKGLTRFFIFIYFFLSQESVGGAIHRATDKQLPRPASEDTKILLSD